MLEVISNKQDFATLHIGDLGRSARPGRRAFSGEATRRMHGTIHPLGLVVQNARSSAVFCTALQGTQVTARREETQANAIFKSSWLMSSHSDRQTVARCIHCMLLTDWFAASSFTSLPLLYIHTLDLLPSTLCAICLLLLLGKHAFLHCSLLQPASSPRDLSCILFRHYVHAQRSAEAATTQYEDARREVDLPTE